MSLNLYNTYYLRIFIFIFATYCLKVHFQLFLVFQGEKFTLMT